MDNNDIMGQIKAAAEELQRRRMQIDNLLESFDNLDYVRSVYHKKYSQLSSCFSGNKGVVYCAITGGYDALNEPTFVTGNVDYVLLTDTDECENVDSNWKTIKLENPQGLSAPMLARWAKTHPFELFPDYDWSVWVDGKLRIKGDIREYISTYKRENGMICFPHYTAKTIIDEASYIIQHKKADPKDLQKQMEDYYNGGYINKGYIVETAVLARDHHDEQLKKVMDDWWSELCTYNHHRDQMSFDYVCWKNGYDYDLNDLLVYGNPWFEAVAVH